MRKSVNLDILSVSRALLDPKIHNHCIMAATKKAKKPAKKAAAKRKPAAKKPAKKAAAKKRR